ncbi:ABC transporter ATP-binding protein [Methylibium sp.]|uniref:ABC transporter ATP-binding protein n=1 Tax=Methylibium sp. TaxID=2067992 RepID=UPI003D10245E
MSLLAVKGLVKRFGGLLATDHLDIEVRPGELHAVIGPNGAGKTTLINLLSGELLPSEGQIVFDGRDVTLWPVHRRTLAGIARSYQISSVFPEFSVLQNVMFAVQAGSGHSFSFWKPVASDTALLEPALAVLEKVGLASRAATPVAELAHGARRQLEIAMTLAMKPKLLLLDEPMAGMSHQESVELTALLLRLKGEYGIVLVEHDMDAIFALADRISVLVYGRPIACGTPQQIRADTGVHAAYLGDGEEVL